MGRSSTTVVDFTKIVMMCSRFIIGPPDVTFTCRL